MIKDTFSFIYATRFWALVTGALAVYLQQKGIIGQPEMILISTITAGFTVVRTVDRATEQKILASAVSSGQVAASDLIKVPPSKTDDMGGAETKSGG